MAVERVSGGSSLIDVLDRVLDKGIVIDAWVRISLVGLDLITVEARIVVASIDTYLKYADAVGLRGLVSRPQFGPGTEPELAVQPARIRKTCPAHPGESRRLARAAPAFRRTFRGDLSDTPRRGCENRFPASAGARSGL